MNTIRERLEQLESANLSKYATKSYETKGRKEPVVRCDIRTEFQRDRDRIIHSKAFRRLKQRMARESIPSECKKREYAVKPGDKRREAKKAGIKNAQKRNRQNRD